MAGPILAKLSGFVGGSSEINMEQKQFDSSSYKKFEFCPICCCWGARARWRRDPIPGSENKPSSDSWCRCLRCHKATPWGLWDISMNSKWIYPSLLNVYKLISSTCTGETDTIYTWIITKHVTSTVKLVLIPFPLITKRLSWPDGAPLEGATRQWMTCFRRWVRAQRVRRRKQLVRF